MLDALDSQQRSQLRACLLGTAIGDRLALPHKAEGTEQSALVLTSLIESGADIEGARKRFRRHLLGFCARIPFDVSFATLLTCMRILLRFRDTSAASSNQEALLRSPIIGAALPHDDARRRALARTLARVSHRDPRAIEAAVFGAELSALCVKHGELDRSTLALMAARAAQHTELREVIEGAVQLSLFKDSALDLRHDGDDVFDTVRVCVWAFVRHGESAVAGATAAISLGGASDVAASIVGGWLGALHGEQALPGDLLTTSNDEPFGPSGLRALVASTVRPRSPRYPRAWALTRNLRSLLWWSRARLVPR